MNKNLEEYKKVFWEEQHEEFMKMMHLLIERHKEVVEDNKDKKDAEFQLWHIIKDAYDEGRKMGDKYFRDLIYELTDAEEYFREKIRSQI